MVDAFYVPPLGEYVRHRSFFRIADPRGGHPFDTHFVRGARYHEAAFNRSHDGQELDIELVPEPGNPHDKWAVALHISGMRIGYIGAEYASMWQDIVIAINRSGKTVVATGLIRDAQEPTATIFLPWLRWDEEYGPDYSEECDVLIAALADDRRLHVLTRRLESLSETDVYLLQSLSALAPSLNWRSQDPGRGIPLQLEWHMKRLYRENRDEKLAAEGAVRQAMRTEVHRMRTTDGASFNAIAAQLGCSPSTARQRYREYLDALTDDTRASIESNLAAQEAELNATILEEYARGAGISAIARNSGISQAKVRQVIKASSVAPAANSNIRQRDERLVRCREACRMQSSGMTQKEIATALGFSLESVKAFLKDGKFYALPWSDAERLRKAWESRAPELDGLGIQAAAETLGMAAMKLKASRKDHAVLSQLYGADLVAGPE